MKPIVIIPARGGSKRIPRKNVTNINGQNALTISILKLQSMNLFEKIVVSTDSLEISEIACRAGASVVIRSRPELSDDETPFEEVVRDFIASKRLKNSKIPILCIYPLALLLTKFEITSALEILGNSPGMFVIAAGQTPVNPLRHNFTISNGKAFLLFPENNDKRSQDLDTVYFDVGMFYLAYPKIWMDREKFWYKNNSKIVIIPKENCIDVDTEEDLIKLKIRYTKLN